MPELPEVETVRRSLEQELVGRHFVALRSLGWPKIVDTHSPELFAEAIAQRQIQQVQRRAKYLLIELDNHETLIVHLRMTGQMLVVAADEPTDRHTHVVVALDNGRELRFHDPRKFGRWSLVDRSGVAALNQRLGSEPLGDDFILDDFAQRLSRKATKIKPTLLDQSVLAGVGNIYADEALWLANIHPLRPANSLNVNEIADLFEAIKTVLRNSIEHRGTTLVNYRDAYGASGENQYHLEAYGRTGEPCRRCGTPIERIVVAQRSTHICPGCQR